MADASTKFLIVGEIQPGSLSEINIRRGECARIFTGAPIPAGATQVVMQEDVQVINNFIHPTKRGRNTFIRQRGEDARRGKVLLRSGIQIGVGEVALLAGLGIMRPKVSARVRVAHFATGNELVAPTERLKPGQIRDSNSPLVTAFVRQFGGEIVRQERVADDLDQLVKKIRAQDGKYDLLLISGGASVGDYDFGRNALVTLGFKIHFEKINLRPGKPLIFATRGRQAAFILPGNPISHLVTLHVAVRPALGKFSASNTNQTLMHTRLAGKFEFRSNSRETFCPARVEILNGELAVRVLRGQSSGDITGLANVNALVRMGGDVKSPKAGDTVAVLLLSIP